jgi:hypothetical protein
LGYACHSFGSLLVADYLAWRASHPTATWRPPLSGVGVGDSFLVEADDEEGVVLAALERCALFHPPAGPSARNSVNESMPRPAEERRFVHAV